MIPLDGEVIDGGVTVNQSAITGESVAVNKTVGSRVYAGTVVESGECIIKVTQINGQGKYDRIVKMIEDSEKLKSSLESKASNLADRLVPFSLFGTIFTYAITRNVTRALSILMVDYSCALKLTMPVAVCLLSTNAVIITQPLKAENTLKRSQRQMLLSLTKPER